MVNDLTDKYELKRTELCKIIPNVIICLLIGINLAEYNLLDSDKMVKDQAIIDVAVYHINYAINSMNSGLNLSGPWLSDTIHANVYGRQVHNYARLGDGLHPKASTVHCVKSHALGNKFINCKLMI